MFSSTRCAAAATAASSESNGCATREREQVALVPAVDRVHRVVDGAVHHREVRTDCCGPCPATTNRAFAAFAFHCVTASARAIAGAPTPSARRPRAARTERRRRSSLISSTCASSFCGRDGFDDAKRVELGALRHERSLPARRCAEHEEADLVLGYMDDAVEADASSSVGQLLGGRARPCLARGRALRRGRGRGMSLRGSSAWHRR